MVARTKYSRYSGVRPHAHRQPVVQRRDQVAAHLQKEDRQGQPARDQKVTLQAALFLLAGGGLVGGTDLRCLRLISRPADRGRAVRSLHRRPLCRQVDRGRQHARNGGNRLLDPQHTRGAGHALDADLQRRDLDVVAGAADRSDDRLAHGGAVVTDIGALGRQVDRGGGHAGHPGDGLLDPGNAGRASHAGDAEAVVTCRGRAVDDVLHDGFLSMRYASNRVLGLPTMSGSSGLSQPVRGNETGREIVPGPIRLCLCSSGQAVV